MYLCENALSTWTTPTLGTIQNWLTQPMGSSWSLMSDCGLSNVMRPVMVSASFSAPTYSPALVLTDSGFWGVNLRSS